METSYTSNWICSEFQKLISPKERNLVFIHTTHECVCVTQFRNLGKHFYVSRFCCNFSLGIRNHFTSCEEKSKCLRKYLVWSEQSTGSGSIQDLCNAITLICGNGRVGREQKY